MARPLSSAGWKQSKQLAKRLAPKSTGLLVSSPYVRCVQTLEPLAALIGSEVITDDCLGEDGPFEPVLDLIARVPAGAILCSHGDIIPATIMALERRGMEILTEPQWRKASVWVLKRNDGRVVQAKAWPPPA